MSRPIILGIVGDSAAGKTTLTRGIAQVLGPENVTLICTDDYHRYDRQQRAEIGYWLAKAYRGQGLATDALRVFVQYAFDNLEVIRLTAHVIDFNTASIKVLEKNRFKLEGCLRQHTKTQNGIFNTFAYGLLKGE